MAKGVCSECDDCVGITPTPEALQYRDGLPIGSARYWKLDMHPDKRGEKPEDGWPICLGSGRRT